MKKTIIIIISLIIISNISYVNYFFEENYSYRNADGSFKYIEEPGKGKNYGGCQKYYGRFLCQHPEKEIGDNRLYRTFTIQPWKFWQWSKIVFSERYQLPYKTP